MKEILKVVNCVINEEEKIPKRIIDKIRSIEKESTDLLNSIVDIDPFEFFMTIENAAPIPCGFEGGSAKFQYFIRKYQLLPAPIKNLSIQYRKPICIGRIEYADAYEFRELGNMQGAISDYRPLVYNQNDIVYYGRIKNLIIDLLRCRESSVGTCFTILDHERVDITDKFEGYIKKSGKWIKKIVSKSDLSILYNEFLQHSDMKKIEIASQYFVSGEYQYMLFRNAILVSSIKKILKPYYDFLCGFVYHRIGGL